MGARPRTGQYVLVGVAIVWDSHGWRLMDEIASAIREQQKDRVEFFDFDGLKDVMTLEAVFPGVGPVFHPPVVGVWVDGTLTMTAKGYAARELLRVRYLGGKREGSS